MKRTFLTCVCLIPVLLIVVTRVPTASATCNYVGGAVSIPDVAIDTAGPVCFTFLYKEYTGPVTNMQTNMQSFVNQFSSAGLWSYMNPVAGGVKETHTNPVMAYFTTPPASATAPVTYRVGFSLIGTPGSLPPGMHVENISFPLVAKYLHVGPYDQIFSSYSALTNAAQTRNYSIQGPTILAYVVDPVDVQQNPALYQTEMLVPIIQNQPSTCVYTAGAATTPDLAVSQASSVCFPFAYREFTSTLDQIDENMTIFIDQFLNAGLKYALKSPDGDPPMAFFPAPPASPTAQVTYRIGFPLITTTVTLPAPMQLQSMDFPKVARLLHIGAYGGIFQTYASLTNAAVGQRYSMTGPTILVYTVNPDSVSDPSQYQTEILAPITFNPPSSCQYVPGTISSADTAVRTASPVCFVMVCKTYTSTVAEIQSNMYDFMGIYFGPSAPAHGLEPAGPPVAYFESPPATSSSSVSYEIGFPLYSAPTQTLPADLHLKLVDFAKAARVVHSGIYENIFSSHAALASAASSQGYNLSGPTVLAYQTDPSKITDTTQWRTEIIAPIAQAPGGVICTGQILSDLQLDCKVDLLDLAVMAGQWLSCNRLPASACN